MAGERIAGQLRVFRAVEDRASCEVYYAAHRRALEAHAMTGLTSLAPGWFDDPSVHVLLLESLHDGEPLCGIRVHVARGRCPLPTETAYRKTSEVSEYVGRHLASGIAEVCGAWADPSVAKTQVFPFVTCAGFSLTASLGARIALASCATYTRPVLLGLGLVVETHLGDAGTFYYPTPTNLSYFMVLRDPATFASALPERRATLLDLRARPRQHRVLESERVTIEVDVDLRLDEHDDEAEDAPREERQVG